VPETDTAAEDDEVGGQDVAQVPCERSFRLEVLELRRRVSVA